MFESLMVDHLWIGLILGFAVVWMILKFIRRTIGRVIGLVFTALGLVRLWTMMNL